MKRRTSSILLSLISLAIISEIEGYSSKYPIYFLTFEFEFTGRGKMILKPGDKIPNARFLVGSNLIRRDAEATLK